MAEKYSHTKYDANVMARAKVTGAPVSTKHCIEICSFLRGKNTKKALSYLDDVLAMEKAIPFKRFNGDVGHRTSVKGPGRYPVKAVSVVKNLIESAVANASSKGLNVDNLYITHVMANEAARPFHYGRQRRRQMKRTHVEIVVLEKEAVVKKVVKKSVKKTEAKPVEKKVETKAEEKKETKPQAKVETKKEAPKEDKKKEAKEDVKKEAPKEKKAEDKSESKEEKAKAQEGKE